jgi:hypothetical protein
LNQENQSTPETPVNRDLLLPYGIPYFAYVGIAALSQDRLPVEVNYILKLLIVPALLYWAWRWYTPVTGPKKISGSIIYGIVAGLIGLALWLLFMMPFVDIKGDAWSGWGFILRLMSASLVVPVFEEYFIRGYILRAAWQWDVNRVKKLKGSLLATLDKDSINDVEPGTWSYMAVGISTLAFTLGHTTIEWPAAIVYSLLMSGLWIVRKDLLSCMVAHGVTNFGLALYVKLTGYWGFW